MVFQFKQFNIKQSQSAMKVGTDGVLLGAWTPIKNQPSTILDIGAGTGLLALMLAQRTSAEMIDAIEIEEGAYEECVENFENSPWNDRLFCFHAGLDEFVEEPEVLYDLIVCNPPFYEEHYKSEKPQRDLARFQDAMPFEELVEAVDFLLSDEGVFSVIIPFHEEEKFILLAADSSLFPFKVTRVKGHATAAIKRSLLAFSRIKTVDIQTDELIIEIDRHQYTDTYQALTKDFYIKL
jgi:tRNA1Val (adenine37-N6)-methyltransferase